MKHRWINRNAITPHKTERECKFCDCIKVTRHEHGTSWSEIWRGLEQIAGEHDPVPPCDRTRISEDPSAAATGAEAHV